MGVLSHRLARRLERGPTAGRALEKLLAVMGEPPLAIPLELSGGARQIGYLSEARCLACGPAELEPGWQVALDGYFLAEAEGGLAALCPRPLGGYVAYGEAGKRFERVDRKSAPRFCGGAWQVFPSLPERYRTPFAAVWYFLRTRCGALLLRLSLLLALAGGACAALSRLVWAVFWDVLPGAASWYTVLLPLAAVLLLGCGAVLAALDTARRLAARCAEPGAANLRWRRSVRGGGGGEAPEGGCKNAARVFLLLHALVILSLTALVGLRGAVRGGGAAALAGSVTAFLPPAATLALLAREAPAVFAARRRAKSERPSPVRPGDSRPPLLACDGSLFADEAAFGVLRPISLRVPHGGKVGVYGPAGSGKSTLLGLLSGAPEPKSGTVYIGGRDCAEVQTASLSHWLRLVPHSSPDAIARAVREGPAILLADHIADRASAEAALAFGGTAVLASARKNLLAGCGRIFRLEGGVLREEEADG